MASAPTSPTRVSPRVTRKALSFGDTTTMVIANPAQAERCITTDDENEVCGVFASDKAQMFKTQLTSRD